MHAAGLIEDAERQPRDLLRMLGPVAAALAELDDAAAANVGVALDLADASAVAVDVVEDEPFAKREIAERQVVGAEAAQNGIEQDRAGDVQVRAPRIEARHVEPLFDVGFDQTACASDAIALALTRWFRMSSGGSPLLVRNRERTEAENRARGSDHAIEAGARDLFEVGAHLFVEMLHEATFIVR